MQALLESEPKRTERVRTPDGVELSVSEWGNPDGPELLFIHGVGQSHLCFFNQINSSLLQTCRIVVYDVRGHGDSEKPSEPEYYDDYKRWADEVQAVIDGMGLRAPILIGWSLGGRVIGQYLAVHGDSRLSGVNFVSGRVIADPVYIGPVPLAAPPKPGTDLEAHILATAAFLRGCFHREPTADAFALALAYNMIVPKDVIVGIRGWPERRDETREVLGKVSVPVLVTHGAQDRVTLVPCAEHTVELTPGAQLSLYEDCGHSPFWEHPERFNRELTEFATKVWRG